MSDDKMITLQKWRGLFRNPLVVHTFATHIRATEGARNILSLHNLDETTPAAIGGLGLAAASVSIIYCPREIVLTIF